MKFKYDYLNNKLWEISNSGILEITQQFPANYGGMGFTLAKSSWITFTVYEKKIKIFAKFTQGEVIYYRKELDILPLNQMPLTAPNFAREIRFEFSEGDRVVKNEKGWWVKG